MVTRSRPASRRGAPAAAAIGVALLALLALAACGEEEDSGVDGGASADNGGGGGGLDGLGGGSDDAGAVGGTDGGEADGATEGDVAGDPDGSGDDADGAGPDGDAAIAPDGEGTDGLGANCPGGAGCSCDGNANCDSALCLWTAGGKACAETCVDTCPKGLACEKVESGGGDAVFACVSKQVTLCAPCSADADCVENGLAAACLDYGAAGSYCGAACGGDGDCPAGYACSDVGKKDKQCKKQATFAAGGGACAGDSDCKPGESCQGGTCGTLEATCGCSPWAIAAGSKTLCKVTNALGTCSAARSCTADGLQPCAAKPAVEETCNAVDDDCDGVTDDLSKTATCSKQAFLAEGSKAACAKDADCAAADERCDEGQGVCLKLLGECFGKPTCSASGQEICNEAKTPKAELCNVEDDDCDGLTDEEFTWSAPGGAAMEVGTPCGLGPCAGGKVVCINLQTASCDTASKAKDEACNAKDDDCDGKTDDDGEVCVDGNLCTLDSCDGASGACSNPSALSCDDGNPCTTEACDSKGGVCVAQFYAGSCDDGDACTVGDACGKDGAGAALCMPGQATKVCDDSNLCTDDACEPKVGCVALPNAATQACYEGAAGTSGVGLCLGGVRACSDGKLSATCAGQVTPAKVEACDGKDDDCDGVTDNGCKAASVQVKLAGIAGEAQDGKRLLRVHGGDGAAVGQSSEGKWRAWLGWTAWLRSVLGL